jgi:hypothetical protein
MVEGDYGSSNRAQLLPTICLEKLCFSTFKRGLWTIGFLDKNISIDLDLKLTTQGSTSPASPAMSGKKKIEIPGCLKDFNLYFRKVISDDSLKIQN